MPAKLLPFPEPRKTPAPAGAPIDLGAIAVRIGRQQFKIRMAATIESVEPVPVRAATPQAPASKREPSVLEDDCVERVIAQPMGRPSPDFQRDRELEFCKLESAPQDGGPDADPTRGPSLCTPGGELSCLCSPNATVGAQAPDVAPTAAGASKTRKLPTSQTQVKVALRAARPDRGDRDNKAARRSQR